ncbi:MAG TPA: anti-sigma-F factor Fin family protein [Firmicutes bacterium]|nr:anti-sigma-F factor Fin family protein [Bacillota bacterium]
MKITYICSGCGALIGCLQLTENQQEQLDLDSLTVEGKEDIIKCSTGDIFIYSLCKYCVENLDFDQSTLPVLQPPDFQ